MKIDKILCPVDFSEPSEQALKYATFLAWSHHSRLCLLHVIEHSHAFDQHMMSYTPPEIQVRLEDEVESQLSSLVLRVEECTSVETDVREGKAFVEIVKKAQDDNIDLIVMGSHGRTGLEHILIGSVAEKVTGKVTCPVLVVKTKDTELKMP